MLPDTPPSRASSLPQGIEGARNAGVTTKTVGASLLAMRSAHSTSMLPDTPPSRASSLPQGIGGSQCRCHHKNCGSELELA
ncbi:hypothetical protein PSJE_24170 [Pseudomonas jessenii]|nr:hypothetical protein PSJE_24170 [Pseudomonas jessenii]